MPGRRPRVAGPRRPPAADRPEAGGSRSDLLVVGRVGKPQGIRGEVTVEVRTDDPQARFADESVLLTEPPERGPLVIASSRDQNGRLVVLFDGVPDRTAAELLRGTLLLVDAATLPAPNDPDVFHDFQLVGLSAQLPDGVRLGDVTEVLHLPHGDVLVVRRDAPAGSSGAGTELLVPFLAAMVPVVDLPAGRLVVDPPEGLLDLAAPDALPPPGNG